MEILKISNIVLKFRVHLDSETIIVSNCFFSQKKRIRGAKLPLNFTEGKNRSQMK